MSKHIHKKNPKELTKEKTKIFWGLEEHKKFSGHNVNTQKLIACLYTNNRQFEIKKIYIIYNSTKKGEEKKERRKYTGSKYRLMDLYMVHPYKGTLIISKK